ncbi:MAG: DNA-binding protein [Candidatus Devosia euplotis]|nr:DNA-binding protein [Candidatus Devosia euplotis]
MEADEAPKSTPLRRAERGERLQVYLPPELEIEVRVKAARERCSMSDLVTRSLEMYLGK